MPPTTTKNNGNRPKLELPQNQPVKLKLLKSTPFTGENTRGKYYLYSVADSDAIEMAYFASEDIHNLIQSNKLKTGAEIQLTKKGKAVEFAIIGQPEPEVSATAETDNLAEILKQSIADAAQAIRSFPDIPFQSEDIRAASLTIFIQRARNA